jgi:hypothetical protein
MSREMFRKCPIFAGMRSKHIEVLESLWAASEGYRIPFGKCPRSSGDPLSNVRRMMVMETLWEMPR